MMIFSQSSKIAVLIAANLILCHEAFAHHGSTSQFDQSKTINVSGTITEVKLVNPHAYVYFDVVNSAGETEGWRCELRSGAILRRTGWTEEMFAAGTKIDIEGSPMWREATGCYTRTIAFNGGEPIARNAELSSEDTDSIVRQAALVDGTPNFSGNWVAPPRVRNNAGGMAAAGRGMAAAGNAAMGGGGGSRYASTAAGLAAVADFVREDNPRFNCVPTNLFADWTFDQHVNLIEQNEETITITYGFMDMVRTIHLGMEEHPENITPSRAGHSIGQWEDSTLVVDTIGFEEGYLDGRNGVKHSDAFHVVERFTLEDDGKTLVRAYTAEDPLYLTAPFDGEDRVGYTASKFERYQCDDLTEERVEGI